MYVLSGLGADGTAGLKEQFLAWAKTLSADVRRYLASNYQSNFSGTTPVESEIQKLKNAQKYAKDRPDIQQMITDFLAASAEAQAVKTVEEERAARPPKRPFVRREPTPGAPPSDTAPPAPEKTLMDTLKENALYIAIGGAALVFLLMRGKK